MAGERGGNGVRSTGGRNAKDGGARGDFLQRHALHARHLRERLSDSGIRGEIDHTFDRHIGVVCLDQRRRGRRFLRLDGGLRERHGRDESEQHESTADGADHVGYYSGMTSPTPVTYRDAGVDIDAGDALVERIKPIVKRTQRPEVLAGIGGFGALVEVPLDRYKRPVLVSGTDGVGTKLRLAIDTGKHDTIGIDLVAMCANDVVVQGAEPLFFLDYYATGKLRVDVAESVIRGIAEGCMQAGAALVGGETAEMPGMYHGDDYDLAGFCVGVVEKDGIIDGRSIAPGDAVIGLASSGPHSNGYSLIRKLIALEKATPATQLEGRPLFDRLLAPTRIYVKPLLELARKLPVKGLAHITGGGITDNIPRVLPDGLEVVLQRKSWARDPIFDWLQRAGSIPLDELYRTFNCGLGMVVVVAAERADEAIALLCSLGETATLIGSVRRGTNGVLIEE